MLFECIWQILIGRNYIEHYYTKMYLWDRFVLISTNLFAVHDVIV